VRAITGRQPPHDPHAEQAVIGALMIDGRHMNDIPSTLTPAKFYSGTNARIFEAMQDLAREHVELGVEVLAT
jgi:replicative DNA helicase